MSRNRKESREPSAPFFSRVFRIDDIPDKGLRKRIEAEPSERKAMAAALDIPRLDSLVFTFTLKPAAARRIKLDGRLAARAVQSCVVTLDPVESQVDEHIETEFWPADDVADLEKHADVQTLTVPPEGPEPVHGGVMDLGQLAYEHLAGALDPFPRKDGATLEWKEGEEDDDSSNPFSVLADLKQE